VSVARTHTLQTVVQSTLIPRWPTIGPVAYAVVRLVMHDCNRGLLIHHTHIYCIWQSGGWINMKHNINKKEHHYTTKLYLVIF